MPDELPDCAFCQDNSEVKVIHEKSGYQISCTSCGSSGPFNKFLVEAISDFKTIMSWSQNE